MISDVEIKYSSSLHNPFDSNIYHSDIGLSSLFSNFQKIKKSFGKMEFVSSEQVQKIISDYPPLAKQKLFELRQLIIETAEENEMEKMVETTKWGEPSYVCKKGSTIRMDWKERNPDYISLYFICTTELVSTFRVLFGEELTFEKNRAIHFNLNEPLPLNIIKKCILLSINYHKIKHLPLLGV